MDEVVKQAMRRWPNVPHCFGWLALDARGDWWMRDARAQACGAFASGAPGAKGARLLHDGLRRFIARNYLPDEHGRWFFQNGPQRVFVELEAAPLVWRILPDGRVQSHDGQAAGGIDGAFLDEHGRLFLHSTRGLGLVHSLDMVDAADALEAGRLPPPGEVCFADLPQRFGFILSPEAQQVHNDKH